MATKTIILTPSGLTVPDVSSGAYPTYPMPNDSITRCIIPWEGGVPADFYAMSSLELIILTQNAGNLYLRGGSTRFDAATPGVVGTSTSAYAAYAGGTADSKSKFIALLATSYSGLAAIHPADVLNFVIDRDAVDALDTYAADLNVIGLRVIYTTGYVAGTHYCNQTDLEYKLSTATVAQLGNDTANAAAPDANVIEQLLSNVDATIDALAGQVYTVPFTTTPAIIKRIAIDLACYELFQRRPVNMDMPKSWQSARDAAMKQLEAVSNMLLRLPDTALVASAESAMEAGDWAKIDFSNENNLEHNF
jgi:phage gp36-like protein